MSDIITGILKIPFIFHPDFRSHILMSSNLEYGGDGGDDKFCFCQHYFDLFLIKKITLDKRFI